MSGKIVHISAQRTPTYDFASCTFHFLVSVEESGGSSCTMEVGVPLGEGPGMHVHEAEEEQFYVVEGHVTFTVGEHTFAARPGDVIHIPRGTQHGFKNTGAIPAKLIAIFAPGGADQVFLQDATLIAEPEE